MLHFFLFSEVLLWTGIKKGPPRKMKFPDADIIIEAVKKNLQKDQQNAKVFW